MTIQYTLRSKTDVQNPALAWPFGKQSTAGTLVLWEQDGARKRFLLYLSSGGNIFTGATFGCDGIDKFYQAGGEIPEIDPVTSDRNWRFHPGTRSTGYGDAVQGRPEFFPDLDFTFSGRCYLEGILPEETSGTEGEPPTEFEVFMRGLRVMTYDIDPLGRLRETGPAFSANNRDVALYILREGARLPLRRFQRWAQSWQDYFDVCDGDLSWDSGPKYGVVGVKRYDAHVVFTAGTDPVTAFRSIVLRSPGCKDQDVNGALRMLTTPDRDPIHRFLYDPSGEVRSNIVKFGLSGAPRDPAKIPNFFIFTFRDLLDEKYKEGHVVVDYPELRDAAGGVLNQVGPIDLGGVMTGSLAQRIARSIARMQSESPFDRTFSITAQFDSSHVAKNDNVELVHRSLGNDSDAPLLARVVKETFEPQKGERKFTLQLTTRDYYRDADHGPLD
jgi:hypothetical protein